MANDATSTATSALTVGMGTGVASIISAGSDAELNAFRALVSPWAWPRAGTAGQLVILNPATGALVQTVGPLNDAAGTNYPITGLAFHPTTGALYGSTGNNPSTTAARLVSINPAAAQVTVIGSFNAGPVNANGVPSTMADLAFDAAGNLYGVGSIDGSQLYWINTATVQETVVGSTGLTSTTGGGLAVSPGGTFSRLRRQAASARTTR